MAGLAAGGHEETEEVLVREHEHVSKMGDRSRGEGGGAPLREPFGGSRYFVMAAVLLKDTSLRANASAIGVMVLVLHIDWQAAVGDPASEQWREAPHPRNSSRSEKLRHVIKCTARSVAGNGGRPATR